MAAAPWPALKISVQLLFANHGVPLSMLKAQGGGFVYNNQMFRVDALDALLLRNVMQQAQLDAQHYGVGAREFAPMLAILRQHSSACRYQECERVSALEILSQSPELVLELKTMSEFARDHSEPILIARGRYRHPETREDLGLALYCGKSYWTFNNSATGDPWRPAITSVFCESVSTKRRQQQRSFVFRL
jgi:hypothetical protein